MNIKRAYHDTVIKLKTIEWNVHSKLHLYFAWYWWVSVMPSKKALEYITNTLDIKFSTQSGYIKVKATP